MAARASQLVLEVLGLSPPPAARVSQLVVEVLVWNGVPPVTLTYPIGPIGYSVIKRPIFFNAPAAQAASGREVRISYAAEPLWEFELTYEVLSDRVGFVDLKNLLGIFLASKGSNVGFLFDDPDDDTVVGQSLGNTDGASSNFTLVRTYGNSTFTGTETIGQADLSRDFNLYLDGVLQGPTTYSVLTTPLKRNAVKFNSTPTTGQAITVDMSYFYYVRFADDQQDFEKFMHKLWRTKTVKLRSLRG